MSQELMPCPFCGAEPMIGQWKQGVSEQWPDATAIECGSDLGDCPVNPSYCCYTREETIAAWNTRPAAQAVAVDEFLREAVDRLSFAVELPGSTVTITKADACAIGTYLQAALEGR